MRRNIVLIVLIFISISVLKAQEKKVQLNYRIEIVYDSLKSKGIDSIFNVLCIVNKTGLVDMDKLYIVTGSSEPNMVKKEYDMVNYANNKNELVINLGKVNENLSLIKVFAAAKGRDEVELSRKPLE